mgnify:CR=1 FL=1
MLLFFLIAAVYHFYAKCWVENNEYMTNRDIHKKTLKPFIVISIYMVVLVAFRAVTVGVDTHSYLWMLDRQNVDSLKEALSFDYYSESGYKLIQYFALKSGCGIRGIIILEAFVFLLPILCFIYKYAENPFLSLFYFIALDYYFFSMSGIRQSMAIGICLIAFEMSQNKKALWFIALVLVATSIHSTAIVFLPVYFLGRLSIKKKYIYISIAIGTIVFILRKPISIFIRQYSRHYYADMDTGGSGMYLYLLLAALMLLLSSDEHWNEKVGQNAIAYMVIIAVILYPVLQFNPSLFRLHYYYSIASIVYIPNGLKKIPDTRIRLVGSLFFFLVAAYYFWAYTSRNMAVIPYSFGF